jgi:hypothetical protein
MSTERFKAHAKPPREHELDLEPLEWWIPENRTNVQPNLTLDGSYAIGLPPGANSDARDIEAAGNFATDAMLLMWADAVQSDARSYEEAANEAALLDWQHEKYELEYTYSLGNLGTAIGDVWVKGCKLIMSSCQMERWLARKLKSDGHPRKPDERLNILRNTLEHLNDALLGETSAAADPDNSRKQSIEDMPEGRLILGFHASYTKAVFGLIALSDLRSRAAEVRSVLDPEPEHETEES